MNDDITEHLIKINTTIGGFIVKFDNLERDLRKYNKRIDDIEVDVKSTKIKESMIRGGWFAFVAIASFITALINIGFKVVGLHW